jgi:hypothetical protein
MAGRSTRRIACLQGPGCLTSDVGSILIGNGKRTRHQILDWSEHQSPAGLAVKVPAAIRHITYPEFARRSPSAWLTILRVILSCGTRRSRRILTRHFDPFSRPNRIRHQIQVCWTKCTHPAHRGDIRQLRMMRPKRLPRIPPCEILALAQDDRLRRLTTLGSHNMDNSILGSVTSSMFHSSSVRPAFLRLVTTHECLAFRRDLPHEATPIRISANSA